ncbi:prepilin peptidase [Microbacterium sp. JZ31]|uniref:prepilin peptidase n=1 Tax=Microbacterium sp. JZ31 TaxID=1906274 RepID=UPI00193153D3|nr:prepilin peptidase [Microbacterium sp. JZ31]
MTASDVLLAAAHAALVVVSLILIRIDIGEHRLPDTIVLPAAIGLAAALGLVAALAGDTAPLGRAALGGIALFGLYLLLRLAFPAGLGGGDVKLAALLGMLLGWHGWADLAAGALAAFVLGGVHAAALLATGRASRDAHIAFGPWMILGAWAGLLA